MPRATADLTATQRFDLKSCPDGFVELRKLTYGEFTERQGIAMKMQAETSASGRQVRDTSATMVLAAAKVAEYELSHTVVDHNLEDENGNKLDFKKPSDVRRLDPQVGNEIGEYIDQMNQFLSDGQAQGNSETASLLQ
jgi:hypothetical protein